MAALLQQAGRLLLGLFSTWMVSWAMLLPAFGQHARLDLLARGDSAYLLFDNARAYDFYQRALVLDSTDFDTHIRLSRTGYDLGLDLIAEDKQEAAFSKFEDSILYARSLVRHFPDSAQSHFLLAATIGNLAFFKSGREKILFGRLVEQHSRRAIQLDSTMAYPYVSLGIYYRELSELNWLEKTLAQVFFGRLPESSFRQALEMLHTALRLRPEFPFLHFELAMTFLSLEQYDDARHHLDIFVGLKPETTQDMRNQAFARQLIEELKGRK